MSDPIVDPPEEDIKRRSEHFLQKWQARLHLADWDLRIVIERIDDSYGAESHYQWRMRRGTIVIPPNVITKTRQDEHFSQFIPDDQIIEEAVVHELEHIAEAPMSEVVMDELSRLIGDSGAAHEMLRAAVRDWREWWINHTTRILLEADRSAWR